MGRERSESVLTYEIRPSGAISARRMVVDTQSVLRHRPDDVSVMLLAPPVGYAPAGRLIRWARKSVPLTAFFSGDGEALDFVAGPEKDWRQLPKGFGEDIADEGEGEDEEEWYSAMVNQVYKNLDEEASLVALHRAVRINEVAANPAGKLITTAMVAVSVVVVMLAVAFMQSNGGFLESLDLESLIGIGGGA